MEDIYLVKKFILYIAFLVTIILFPTNDHTYAAAINIELTSNVTARFTLQNGEEIKYITLSKGQYFRATEVEGNWQIKVGNGIITIAERFAVKTSKKFSLSPQTNKVELHTKTFSPVYAQHAKKGKPLATMAKNVRISSNGMKGNYFEVVIGGRKGYIHRDDVEIDTGVPILIYHHFVKNQAQSVYKNSSSVYDIDLFTQQMDYLKSKGFTTISLKDLDLWMKRQQALPAKAVVLTFDDANLSVEKLVYPILKQRKMIATTFVIGDRVKEEENEFDMNKIQFTSFDGLQKINDIFDLEYHTYGLHVFNSVTLKSGLQYASPNALKFDFLNAKDVLAQLNPNAQPSYFSYPYGKYLKEHEPMLIQQGVSLAFLNKGGKAKISSPRLYVPRVPVPNTMTLKQFVQTVNN